MKIGFISLGCAKNLVDSEELMGQLLALGHSLTNKKNEAEAIFINTCGFINSAKKESIDTILEIAEYKEKNLKYLIVTGCLSQRYKKDLEKELPEVDLFITIDEYPHFSELVSKLFNQESVLIKKAERLLTSKPWMAYLKIAEGCSNRCAYCAIPLIRGNHVSRDMDSILKEAHNLAEKGVKELVLIAQDTTKYGFDWDQKLHLLDLLKELNKIEKLHWIRVLYMYPDEITKELVLGMSKLDKVVPYFDIPTQHASNRMLELMNRRGTIESTEELCQLIRKTFKNSTLRTTIIVGFPDEKEEDFDKLISSIEKIKWDRLGAFTYSLEEDTASYSMKNQISEKLKEERLRKLMLVQKEISQKNSEKYIGQTIEVLIEAYDSMKNLYRGRSQFSAPDGVDGIVFVRSEIALTLGEFYNVVIDKANAYDLFGKIKSL